MGIYKRENGFFYFKITIDGLSIKKSLKTKNLEIANRRFDLWLDRQYSSVDFNKHDMLIDNKTTPYKEDKNINKSVLEAFTEYIETNSLKSLSSGTMRLKNKLKEILVDNHLHSFNLINQTFLNKLIKYLQNEYQESYVDKLLTQLIAFFHYSIKQDYMEDKMFNRLEFPSYQTKSRELVISEKELIEIFNYLKSNRDKDFYFYLKTLFHTDSRPGEIRNLRVSDINYNEGSIKVFQHKTNKLKEVPVRSIYLSELKAYIEANDIKDYLFDGASRKPDYYGKKFKGLIQALHLNPKYILYDFRHSSATFLLNKTGDIEMVKEQIGHSSLTMTKNYTHRTLSNRKQILDTIDMNF